MYLKQLEVAGFKSFAERIHVDFVPGVTAVVGPNGSGKSNITEAIRWVLGEQSAKSLRGGKMEDVIFSGSDSRKPLNFAEVTLILDNGDGALPLDYAEVSVTRRVYRTGDSEYLLNGQSCRLKDIVELFIDTGLGKEAFSIIGQGRVDQILNSKPEDRRVILEEAAGVLKYKNRRKKADQKLTETQENLYRVQDILHELEGQVEPLKIQASLAREYLAYKEDLKHTEAALLGYEIGSMTADWENKKQQLADMSTKEKEMKLELDRTDSILNEKQTMRIQCEKQIETSQAILLKLTEETEQLEGRRQVLVERRKNADQNEDQLNQKLKEIDQQLVRVNHKIKENKEKAADYKSDTAFLKKQLAELDQFLNTSVNQIEEQLEQAKNDYFECLNDQTALKNELTYLEQQQKQDSVRADKLTGQNVTFIQEREKHQQRYTELQGVIQKKTEELERMSAEYRELQERRSQLLQEAEQFEAKLYKAYQYVSEAKSRKSMLESMEEEFSGFYQGVKEILKARGNALSGIEGAVAELIDVEKETETAIETALGGSMQSIVTVSEKEARDAIQFLKKNRMGRATFLPMTVIKSRLVPSSVLHQINGHQAFINTASALVSFDEKYRNVIENLLGNVIVARDLKGANELAKQLGYRYRIVTLDGDLVNPGGSMTGGAQAKKSSSIFSRKNELDQLTAQIPDFEQTAVKLEKKVQELKKQAAAADHEMETLRTAGEQMRIQESEMKAELREAEAALKKTDEQLALYDLEIAEYQDASKSVTARTADIKQKLEKSGVELEQLDLAIKELTKQKNVQSSSRDEKIQVKSELQSKLAVSEEKLSQSKREERELQETLLELEQNKKNTAEDLTWLSKEMTSGEDQTVVLQRQIADKQAERQSLMNGLGAKKEEREELEETIQKLTASYKELSRLHQGLSEGINDLRVKNGRLESDIDYRLNKLQEEYELSYEAAIEEFPLVVDPEEAKVKVKLIKLSISELGSVNLGAIEEYDRVSERYEFLIEQQTDLNEAKSNLMQVISEMDDEMSRRFKETFDQVKVHFASVFVELFGGGRAELKLTDPQDMLHTGIDIVAQPPGKKLQNLSLLSGGERALTAIALLFAILHVRPVPFCILDEVEAALDEANVQRFSQYLNRFSEQSQFIVITHRKGTMEGADVLYGVTMQESGVSKLVSVKFEEEQNMLT
ncbi:chromosome segregation protein SMC [Jeotgalibacillus sp. R-1-5s-1]|uniref:chromosome segregation protein SMC n=1 Tax=Jeotgalibacillus sp. R-1-5s-1 TaxID=2555897 RepID=UPI00106C023B|nr:chromosome segregation protein SMC [Jeotgalibacillus sp. R-1-5s-1]TFE03527.1 chromosome segregation protein SMC [Jeotgalibacillus sp. R-1-5s-1]